VKAVGLTGELFSLSTLIRSSTSLSRNATTRPMTSGEEEHGWTSRDGGSSPSARGVRASPALRR
jgi:hypothetical protein